LGGFANEKVTNDSTKGINAEDAIIKIGIAIGPRTWFGDEYKNNVSRNGIVLNNLFSGAFSYGIAITSATNFTVQGNSFFGNTSFIGARGPNCSAVDTVPTPAQFIIETNTTSSLTLSSDFVSINDGDSLTCVLPPNGGDFWPFGFNPSNSTNLSNSTNPSNPSNPTNPTNPTNPSTPATNNHDSRRSGGIAAGVILGVLFCGLATWLIRRCVLQRKARQQFNQF